MYLDCCASYGLTLDAKGPLILLYARAGEESRIEGLQAGADDHLAKPFSAGTGGPCGVPSEIGLRSA